MNRRIAKKIVKSYSDLKSYKGRHNKGQIFKAHRMMGAALPEIETPEPETTLVSLESLTVPQLKEKAKEAGVTGYSKMKKADLIAALGEK